MSDKRLYATGSLLELALSLRLLGSCAGEPDTRILSLHEPSFVNKYNFSYLYLSYQSMEEQIDFARRHSGVRKDNPSLYIDMYNDFRSRAIYKYDRIANMVVVNNYPFETSEVAELAYVDRALLSRKHSGIVIANPRNDVEAAALDVGECYRKLTQEGIDRLVSDLHGVYDALLDKECRAIVKPL